MITIYISIFTGKSVVYKYKSNLKHLYIMFIRYWFVNLCNVDLELLISPLPPIKSARQLVLKVTPEQEVIKELFRLFGHYKLGLCKSSIKRKFILAYVLDDYLNPNVTLGQLCIN